MKHENNIENITFGKIIKKYIWYFIAFIIIYPLFGLIKPFNDFSGHLNAEYFSFYGTFISGILIPPLTFFTIILLIENYFLLYKQNKETKEQIESEKVSSIIRDLENNMIKLIEFKNKVVDDFYLDKNDMDYYNKTHKVRSIYDELNSKKKFFNFCINEMKNIMHDYNTAEFSSKNNIDEDKIVNQEIILIKNNMINRYNRIKEYRQQENPMKILYIYNDLFAKYHDEIEPYKNIIISMFNLIESFQNHRLKYESKEFMEMFDDGEKILFNYFRISLITTEIVFIHYIFYETGKLKYREILRKIDFNEILELADIYYLFPEDKNHFMSIKSDNKEKTI